MKNTKKNIIPVIAVLVLIVIIILFMLLVGDATLCLVDGADAALRSNGKIVDFCLRLNLIAWYRLVKLVLRETCIRLGMGDTIEAQLEAYRVVNQALDQKMAQLKALDLERWKQ